MGSGPSKPSGGNNNGVDYGTMKRTPSASFGRLRFDSPRSTPGSGRGGTLSRRRKERTMMQQVGSDNNNIMAIGKETSPLLGGIAASAASSTGQHRLLKSASVSDGSGTPPDYATLSGGSPPLAVWIGPALCCAMAYALYNIFIKKGSATINPVLGGVILQLVAAMLGVILLLVLVTCEGGTDDVLVYDGAGIRWAILAGVAVGSAEIVSFFVSSLGVQAMQSIPIIIGGSVMFGTTIGAVFLKEELTYRGWVGVVMISCGISLVGLDDTGDSAWRYGETICMYIYT